MISDIDPTSKCPGYDGPAIELDIQQFKTDVQESFPNVDAEASCTADQMNQLVDNDFDRTITENGVEVAKLSGATFAGEVLNPDGDNPTAPNQLVTKSYVDAAIALAWPPSTQTYEEFILSAVIPDLYWTMQETSGTLADDATPNNQNGNIISTVVLDQQSLIPSEPDRKSFLYNNDISGPRIERQSPHPEDNYSGLMSFGVCLNYQGPDDVYPFSISEYGPDRYLYLKINSSIGNTIEVSIPTAGGSYAFNTSQSVPTGTECLIIVVVNEPLSECKVYFNGVLVHTEPLPVISLPLSGDFIVGAWKPFAAPVWTGSDAYLSDFFYLNEFISDSGASIIYDRWLNGSS